MVPDAGGAPTLSDALRPAITAWAVGVVEIKLPPGKRKTRLLAVAISGEPAEVTPEALTREMIADLLTVADVRVATDCQALLLGHGGKAKLGLMRERQRVQQVEVDRHPRGYAVTLAEGCPGCERRWRDPARGRIARVPGVGVP